MGRDVGEGGRERKMSSVTPLKFNLWAKTSSVLELVMFMGFFVLLTLLILFFC